MLTFPPFMSRSTSFSFNNINVQVTSGNFIETRFETSTSFSKFAATGQPRKFANWPTKNTQGCHIAIIFKKYMALNNESTLRVFTEEKKFY